jgi:hypothetical protein
MAVLKAGARFKSAVCETQVMVVKAPAGEHDLRCGGLAMLGGTETAPAGASPDPAHSGESLIGKELLCTKGGKGSLALGSEPLAVKQAKQLPSSD